MAVRPSLTSKIPEGTCEEFYETSQQKEASGIFLVFICWMAIFNPFLMMFTLGPVNQLLSFFNGQLGVNNAELFHTVVTVLKYILIIGGIVSSYCLYKFKPGSLPLGKIYLLVQVVILTVVFLKYMSVLGQAFDAGMFPLTRANAPSYLFVGTRMPMLGISYFVKNAMLRIGSSLATFGVWFSYLSLSKQLRQQFYPVKYDLD